MRGHRDWKAIMGMLLAGVLIVGCFVPVAYGVYKVYETETTQTVTLLVNVPPDKLWTDAVATAKENNVKIQKLDDKERYLEGVRQDGIKGYARVITGPNEKTSMLAITLEKGKDPAKERASMIASVMQTCSKLSLTCTEQEKKK